MWGLQHRYDPHRQYLHNWSYDDPTQHNQPQLSLTGTMRGRRSFCTNAITRSMTGIHVLSCAGQQLGSTEVKDRGEESRGKGNGGQQRRHRETDGPGQDYSGRYGSGFFFFFSLSFSSDFSVTSGPGSLHSRKGVWNPCSTKTKTKVWKPQQVRGCTWEKCPQNCDLSHVASIRPSHSFGTR